MRHGKTGEDVTVWAVDEVRGLGVKTMRYRSAGRVCYDSSLI